MPNEPKLGESVEFAENPEPRCACVLLLDTSGSMDGPKIAALNEGLRDFKWALVSDPLATLRVEVAVVTFDSQVATVRDFVNADDLVPPELVAQGYTCMGAGINAALDLIEARKAVYKSHSVAYFRPWVFMITDGEPEGEAPTVTQQAAQRVKDGERDKRVVFFAVGVEGANLNRLAEITVRAPVMLAGLNFAEMFLWLSKSMGAVARSKPDDGQVPLPPPGWTAL